MRVLLSDQDRQSAERLRDDLQAGNAGWQVEIATDTEEFQALAATGDYRVVLWELSTPGAAGLLSIRRIRAAAPAAVLLVSVFPGGEALAAQALSAGADAYLTHRPGWSGELIAMLAQVEGTENLAPPLKEAAEETKKEAGASVEPSEAGVAQLEQAIRNLSAAVRGLESVREPHDLPAQVLEAAGHLVESDAAVCWMNLTCSGEGRQEAQASAGLSEADADRVAQRLETLLRTGHLPRQAMVFTDLDEYRRRGSEVALQLTLGGAGLASAVWIPVVLAGEPVGFVFLGSRRKGAFRTWMQPVLDLFSAEIGRAAAAATVFYEMQLSAGLAHQLLRISVALNARDDLEDVLRRVAEAAVSIAGGACCWVEILDEQGQQFVSTCRHCPDAQLARDLYVEVHRAAWQAVETQAPAQISVLASGGASYQVIAVPLRAEGRVVGVMMLAHLTSRRVGSTALNALQVLATQAASAVRNMQLLALAAERTRRMEAAAVQAREEETRARTVLQAAASVTESRDLDETITQIARSAAQEIGFERVRVFLADHQSGALHGRAEAYGDGSVLNIDTQSIALRAGADLLADVALSSAPYLLYSVAGEEQEEGRNYEQLLMPLRWQGELMGIIAADNRSSRRSITSQQTRLLRALATLAAVAIERARMDEVRHQLISAMSHELRRPLASIQAYNELVLGGDAGPVNEEQTRYLRRVEEGCERQARMIEDLLSWSKLRSGKITVDRKQADLREAVLAVAAELEPKARLAEVALVVEASPELPPVETDPNLLEQVLSNLVDNALKYNHPGGRVAVRLRGEERNAVIEVTDTGPGIPPEFRGKIFEEFERGPRELRGTTEGTGLGLPIAARLAEYLGGSLALESIVGEGSTFSVRLPYAR
jgi:signal transduction histidine kinase/DNA-binding NarL/FixJ family response regulator